MVLSTKYKIQYFKKLIYKYIKNRQGSITLSKKYIIGNLINNFIYTIFRNIKKIRKY